MSLFPPPPGADGRTTFHCSVAIRIPDGSIHWEMASLYDDVIRGDRAITALEDFAESICPGSEIVHIMPQPSWRDPAHGDTAAN